MVEAEPNVMVLLRADVACSHPVLGALLEDRLHCERLVRHSFAAFFSHRYSDLRFPYSDRRSWIVSLCQGEQDAGMNHGSLIRGESFPLTSTDSGCYALAYQ